MSKEIEKIEEHTEFEHFELDERLLRGVVFMGYERPTPIQEQAIPPALKGLDVMGAAQTGTGKTAAFGLPILHRVLNEKHEKPMALVLSPTRELAVQIEDSFKHFAKYTKLKVLAVYGGVGYGPQMDGLKKGADVIVATPGRLLDHVARGTLSLDSLKMLVLDEADRMLDMGFLPDVRRIMARVPKERQTMLFSATFPDEVMRLSKEILIDPIHVQIGQKSSAARGLTHTAFPVPAHLKPDLLAEILIELNSPAVLIFTRTKHRADRIQKLLSKKEFEVTSLHSDRTQKQRMAALDGFKKGKFNVMVATDIAARGIDVSGITHVINYDLPATAEDYVHRTGRTARAEKLGDALTLVAPDEEILLREIEKHLGQQMTRSALNHFDYMKPAPEKANSLQKTSGTIGPQTKSFQSSHRRPKIPRRTGR
ncbi:MAG: DEAD/DEAH box helicase [Calditrichaeota bacterium]|nr:DEAD/DEAH box helicase [Calditrichota bacterium]MCB9369216.1 DEAD/DEAH box helicase [Calditrichota bacterium]